MTFPYRFRTIANGSSFAINFQKTNVNGVIMRVISTVILILSAGLSACTSVPSAPANDTLKFIASDDLKKSGLPLSSAVEADGWIFLSGALGTVPGKGFVERGIEPETRQTLDNIKSLLAEQGLGMDRIVKCTVMLADMKEWPAFNDIYKEYFTDNYPARSAFGASGLAIDARVEIECIARR